MKLLNTFTILALTAILNNTSAQTKKYDFEKKPFWSDEFSKNGKPDQTKWSYQTGGNGFGNNELQYYTEAAENATVKDGKLFIKAIKEQKENRNYTSAKLVSKGKGDFLYGRFEISAKLPTGRGTWPAIWMMPVDNAYGGWPRSGEIDIMEHVGYDPQMVHTTIHTEAYNHKINTQKAGKRIVEGAMTGFHKYRVDWTPDAIRGYIDDQLLFDTPNEGKGDKFWPFDKSFYMILNLAVGGDWGGSKGVDDQVFPATFEVDHVRVYKMIEKK